MDRIGLIAIGKEKTQIPLDSVSIQANIYGILAHFEATFAYTNSTQNPIEVEFKHPLYSESVLVGIEAVIDGKTIKGIVKEKSEAKTVYEDAIASGDTAVLVEEESQDIVGILLGNLPPGKSVSVRLQLLQELEIVQEGIRLLLPTTLKPRYQLSSDPSSQQQAPVAPIFPSIEQNIVPAIYKFSFELLLVGEIGKLKQILSPSHTLSEFLAPDGRKGMRLASPDPLNTDLLVFIDFDDIRPLSALIESPLTERAEKPAQHPYIDNPAVLLTFMPKSQEKDLSPKSEFVFVIDQSGSMRGSPMLEARETLDILLRSLSPGCYFNVIGFGTRYVSLFPEGSVEYTQASLDKAVQHVSHLTANLGGTEILTPLQYIFSKNHMPGLARQIFLLTDGGVSNIEAVVKTVADNSSHTRVFTFGIGSGVSTALVNRVAKAGKGRAVFISSSDRMQARVMEVMNTAMSPSFTDISVTGSKSMVVYPQSIPVLFENKPFVVVGFFNEKIVKGEKVNATLKYSSQSGTKATTIEFSLTDSASAHFPHLPQQLVHQFGVSKVLRDLEGSLSSKDECITLSCYTNIMCKHTSFVAVGEATQQMIQGSMKIYNVRMNPVTFDSFGYGSEPLQGRVMRSASPIGATPASGNMPGFMMYAAPPSTSRVYGASMGMAPIPSVPGSVFNRFDHVDSMIQPSFSKVSRLDNVGISYSPIEASTDLFSVVESAPRTLYTDSLSKRAELYSDSSSLSGHISIMKLQKAEGYWEYSGQLESLLGCTKAKESCPSEIKDVAIWMTVLCLSCLQQNFMKYRSEWLQVYNKGERWVRSKIGAAPSYEQMLELATDFLKK